MLEPRPSKLVESPTHIVDGRAVTFTVAGVSIVTVTVAESVQPKLLVPTTLYVVLYVGDAVVLSHKVQESPVDGDHVRLVPFLACNLTVLPLQSAGIGSIVILAGAINLIMKVSLLQAELPTALIIDIDAVSEILTLTDGPVVG